MKNKNIVLVLALLFGSLGIHRFYLGQIVVGIIFILLFICFAPVMLFVGFIDFLNFLSMSKKTYNKLYNKDSKKCLECLEYIDIEAKRCKFCGDICNNKNLK